MRRVLITGVAGMIGSHLLDALLENKYQVKGIDNLSVGKIENIQHNLNHRNFKFIKMDIMDFDALKNVVKNVDVIAHLAAAKKIGEKQSAISTLNINAEGTHNVLESAKKKRIKVIFASTSDVYGLSKDLPFKEDGNLTVGPPAVKRWAYAASKIYGEQLVMAYYKEHNVPVVIIRYFGCFSHRSSFTWSGGHIPIFIDAILKNKEVLIHGDGSQIRSMGYVDDTVRGTIMALENPKAIGNIFNIGSNEEKSVLEAAYIIHKIANTGKELKLRFIPYKRIFGEYKEIMRRVPDLTKVKKILGYTPEISFKEAVKRTIVIKRAQLK